MAALRTRYSQNRLLQPSLTTWQNSILHLVCIKFTLHKMDTSFEMFKRCSNHLHLTFFLLLCYWLLGVEYSQSNLPHGFVADIKAKELLERQPELQYFEEILIDYLIDGSITKTKRGEGQALGMKVWTSMLCFETRPPAGCKAFQVALCTANSTTQWIVDLLATVEVHHSVLLWLPNTSHHVIFITGPPIIDIAGGTPAHRYWSSAADRKCV